MPTVRTLDESDYCPAVLHIHADRAHGLRYGENPHQQAALYSFGQRRRGRGAEQLHGKELSYNNLVDLDAAWQLVHEFDAPAAAIIKHTNPCGCAEQATLAEAYRKALEADPVSAFGGVIAFNRELDEETARESRQDFHRSHRRARLLAATRLTSCSRRRICGWCEVGRWRRPSWWSNPSRGGYLAQTADTHASIAASVRGENQARSRRTKNGARSTSAGRSRKHVKSNAIVYARAGQTRQRRRGPDEPRGFGESRRDESRAPAGRERWSRPTRSFRFPMASKKRRSTASRP